MKLRRFHVQALVGILLMVSMALLEHALHDTRLARQFSSNSYVVLSSLMRAVKGQLDTEPPRVVIIDISKLSPGEDAYGAYTPPEKLESLLDQLSAGPRPRVIAVDVDLSPVLTRDGYMTPPGFADLMKTATTLRTKHHIPVFFGVERMAFHRREYWLRDEAWAEHAAWLGIPQGREYMIPVALQWEEAGETTTLPSLAAAMANPHGDEELRQWARRQATETVALEEMETGAEDARVSMALSDLSLVQGLKATVIPCDAAGVIPDLLLRSEDLGGKIILIGKVREALDQFAPPGFRNRVEGIFLHAAGALTLKEAPLRALNVSTGTKLSLGIMGAFVLFHTIALLRRKSTADPYHSLAHDIQFSFLANLSIGLLTVLFAAGLVMFLDLLWLEVLLVLFFLLFHTLAECWIALCFRTRTQH